ncbi:cisplatin damage response ATP-dependent DNA ligase [Albimonas sp. CAU 1670]|uniref:cisplatin damage response ATP-dependent DNA ligase n=1 Tax=Albimonas sp. CAU 1670 TaxID=3032599 RepID=UPI0023DAA54C|nr:cisplatin damage response ATP-dependent DNA ligase [Albimonas sp. CAU 1670]MDF2231115.1 cisplatin damage response ATP-dependent DNA ligase [Albimonas sp. CAU 1670]
MRRFAQLLEALVLSPRRTAKLQLLQDYFRTTPDPDRGWALAALAGGLELPNLTASVIRGVAEARVDPALFRLSYDFVGDLAETTALIWPDPLGPPGPPPGLDEVVRTLQAATRSDRPGILAALFDRLDSSARFALIKLCTGGMRVGVSARLARTALAEGFGRPLERIEELWFVLSPPYADLFRWLEGGPEPDADLSLAFRPMMLANPVEDARLETLVPADHAAEIKWDGIRVQAVATESGRRLYSRTGEDLGPAFPDLLDAMDWRGCVDGELLVVVDGQVRPFADLQTRLGRKRVTAKMLAELPAHIRAYDLLHDGEADLRPLPYDERRARLEAWRAAHAPARLDVSAEVPFADWQELAAIRAAQREEGEEGLMLKRRDAPYLGGRPIGPWWKWKRDPLTADCVLMYAQRGHGKRSSFYSDYTFGAWEETEDGPRLAPVGKAYSGFTDEELVELDRWVRANMTERFGPVRAVKPGLVLEVAFDALQASARHRSGIAMRFPRIKRIRWDKPIEEADRLATLRAMLPG